MEKVDLSNSRIKTFLKNSHYLLYGDRDNWFHPKDTCSTWRLVLSICFAIICTAPISIFLYLWNHFAESKDQHIESRVYDPFNFVFNIAIAVVGITFLDIIFYAGEIADLAPYLGGTGYMIFYSYIVGIPVVALVGLVIYGIGTCAIYILAWGIKLYEKYEAYKQSVGGKPIKPKKSSALKELYQSWKDKYCKPVKWE